MFVTLAEPKLVQQILQEISDDWRGSDDPPEILLCDVDNFTQGVSYLVLAIEIEIVQNITQNKVNSYKEFYRVIDDFGRPAVYDSRLFKILDKRLPTNVIYDKDILSSDGELCIQISISPQETILPPRNQTVWVRFQVPDLKILGICTDFTKNPDAAERLLPILLVYKIDRPDIVYTRAGSHSDIF